MSSCGILVTQEDISNPGTRSTSAQTSSASARENHMSQQPMAMGGGDGALTRDGRNVVSFNLLACSFFSQRIKVVEKESEK